jgi:hypothetical protein
MDSRTLERFQSKCVEAAEPHPKLGTKCLEWQSVINGGYGVLRVGSKKDGSRRLRSAHLLSYEHFVGPIPDGLDVDHLCRNKRCVRPDHLEAVTHAENMRRAAEGQVSYQSLVTHCPAGHEYTPENTAIYESKGYKSRYCKACRVPSSRKHRAKKRGEEVEGKDEVAGLKLRFREKCAVQEVLHEKLGTPCWLWTGAKFPSGYGAFWLEGKTERAHVASWKILKGPVPEGMEIDHKCRRVDCVNPEHLEPVTHQENIDRTEKGARGSKNAAKTHCKNGHPYDDANTILAKNQFGGPKRDCRICTNKNKQQRRAAKKEAAE